MSVNVKQNGSLTKVGGLYHDSTLGQELDEFDVSTADMADGDYIITKSGSTWYRKALSKIWDYIRDKIGIADSGSTFLRKNGTWGTPANNRVTQSPSSTNSAYEVLLSGTADNTERTETSNKNSSFTHNPSTAATTIERQNATTTSAYSDLSLGNNIADGTVGATHGRLRVFGQSQYYVSIWDGLNVLTNNRALYLPNRQGVITTTNILGTDESQKTTVDGVTARRADQAYAIGDHFIIDNQFCTAIAAIASGAILTQNTNYKVETIGEILTRLEQAIQ